MIRVKYFPTNGGVEESDSPTLVEWFVNRFGPEMQLPQGLRITQGNAVRDNDVTDEISLGDPNNHLNRIAGEYCVMEVPGSPVVVQIVISVVVAVAAVLLTPTIDPPSNVNRRQQSASNSLGNRQNEPKPGNRFPDVRGFEPAVYMDLLMEPYRRYADNLEDEYLYGTVSAGKADILTPRDGLTPISSIVGAQFNGFWPNTSPNSGDSPFLNIGGVITRPVVAASRNRSVNGQELSPPNQLQTVGVKYRAYASGLLEVTEGPTELNFAELYEIGDTVTLDEFYSYRFVGDFQVPTFPIGFTDTFPAYERNSVNGSYVVTAVTTKSITLNVAVFPQWSYFGSGFDVREEVWRYDGTPVEAQGLYYIGGGNPPGSPFLWTRVTSIPAVSGVFDGTVGPIRLVDGSTGGWINLLAQNGLRKASGSEDYATSVVFRFTIYEVTEAGDRTGANIVLPDITLVSNPVLITSQVALTTDFTNSFFRAEMVGQRITLTDKDFDGTIVDEVKWAALYMTEDLGGWDDPGDVTTAHVKIRQTATALSVQERRVNFGVKRYERTYLGNGQVSATQDKASDEFADAVVGLALDPTTGSGTTLADIDVDSLYSVQEEIASYFGTRTAVKFGYVFDSTELTFEDHLTLIGRAVFCRVFRIGNQYSFKFIRPRAPGETAILLNHRFKYARTDKRRRDFVNQKQNDGVTVTYKDINTRVFETFSIPLGSTPINPLNVELSGVIYRQTAEWFGYREWNKLQFRRVSHETQAHSYARGLVPDDRIQMANDTSTLSQGGQVLEQNGLFLRLANGTKVTEGTQYSITLLYFSGVVENILCVAAPEIGENWIKLFSLPAEELYTGNLKWRTGYNLYEDVEKEKDDMLVESVQVRVSNGQERVTVKAVNYDVRYWQNDPQEVSTGSFSTAFNDSFDKGQ